VKQLKFEIKNFMELKHLSYCIKIHVRY